MDLLWEQAFDFRHWLSGGVDLGEMFWLRVHLSNPLGPVPWWVDRGLPTLLSFDLLERSSLRSARSLHLSIPPRGTSRALGMISVRAAPTYLGALGQRHIPLLTLSLGGNPRR